jgi:hypothetical protein
VDDDADRRGRSKPPRSPSDRAAAVAVAMRASGVAAMASIATIDVSPSATARYRRETAARAVEVAHAARDRSTISGQARRA